jgi:hypothetical protein
MSKWPITLDDIGRLPLRAQVAFAARCARLVQPMFDNESVATAIRMAEAFGAGMRVLKADAVRAAREAATSVDHSSDLNQSAVYAANAAAGGAANDAADVAYAVVGAVESARAALTNHIVEASLGGNDRGAGPLAFNTTTKFDLVASHVAEDQIRSDFDLISDFSKANPSGPFPPAIFPPSIAISSRAPIAFSDEHGPAIIVAWDPATVPPKEYGDLLKALNDLVKANGGRGLRRLTGGTFKTPVSEGVPQ